MCTLQPNTDPDRPQVVAAWMIADGERAEVERRADDGEFDP